MEYSSKNEALDVPCQVLCGTLWGFGLRGISSQPHDSKGASAFRIGWLWQRFFCMVVHSVEWHEMSGPTGLFQGKVSLPLFFLFFFLSLSLCLSLSTYIYIYIHGHKDITDEIENIWLMQKKQVKSLLSNPCRPKVKLCGRFLKLNSMVDPQPGAWHNPLESHKPRTAQWWAPAWTFSLKTPRQCPTLRCLEAVGDDNSSKWVVLP